MQHAARCLCLALCAAGCSATSQPSAPSPSSERALPPELPFYGEPEPPADTWARVAGSISGTHAYGLAVSDAGDVVWGGEFSGPADFGGGQVITRTSYNGYVASYDRAGRFLWGRHLPGQGVHVHGLAQDRQGHIALVGGAGDGVDAGGGPVSVLGSSLFVAKYDSDGKYLWSRPLPEVLLANATGAQFDSQGNLYVVGSFHGTVDLGSGPLSAGTRLGVSFLAKLDQNGNTRWSRAIGGGEEAGGNHVSKTVVAVDAMDNVIVSGAFWGTQDLGAGPHTSNGATDLFMAKYDPFGGQLFATPIGSDVLDSAWELAVSAQGDAFLLANVDDGKLTSSLLVRVRADGTPLWSRHMMAASTWVFASALVLDGEQALVSGPLVGTTDFGAQRLEEGCGNLFIVRFNEHGSPLWARCLGSRDVSSSYVAPWKLALDSAGRLLIAGDMHGPLKLPVNHLNTQTMPLGTDGRIFLARLAL